MKSFFMNRNCSNKAIYSTELYIHRVKLFASWSRGGGVEGVSVGLWVSQCIPLSLHSMYVCTVRGSGKRSLSFTSHPSIKTKQIAPNIRAYSLLGLTGARCSQVTRAQESCSNDANDACFCFSYPKTGNPFFFRCNSSWYCYISFSLISTTMFHYEAKADWKNYCTERINSPSCCRLPFQLHNYQSKVSVKELHWS